MRIKRTTTSSSAARRRRTRLIAAASGMAAAGALMVPVSAAADAPTTYSASELKAVGDAVLEADVAGTAWYVDKKT
ncbi:serine protease, partial [Streptomyces beijiangensis]|nr:serine protease [Streptomyces beijiangensis]